MSWTDERVALLKRLWKDGKSAAEIAKALSKGVTRNAVIGKAHRMGLSGRPSPIKKSASGSEKKSAKFPLKKIRGVKGVNKSSATSAKKRNAPPSKETAKSKKSEKENLQPSGGVSLIDLTERMCRWPIGDPREDDFTFCGRSINEGTPYCSSHAAMAYQTSSRTRTTMISRKVIKKKADGK